MQGLTGVRILSLAGLTVCSWLLAESLAGSGLACGVEGGCNDVLGSVWGRPLGIPLPLLGLVQFGFLLTLSLTPGRWSSWTLRRLAFAGGLTGIGLILIQALVLGRFCPLCLVVDVVALLTALFALAGNTAEIVPEFDRRAATVWLVGGLLAAVGGAAGWAGLWLDVQAGNPPPEILALRHPTRVTIVEIANFQCKHCRVMHKVLDRLEAEMGDHRVHRVCFTVSLPNHPQSRDVSRALYCARQQGRDRAMIDLLFLSKSVDAKQCREAALRLRLSLPTFDACLTDSELDSELDRELGWLTAASADGLPEVWVDQQRLSGGRKFDTLREAVRSAEQKRREEGVFVGPTR